MTARREVTEKGGVVFAVPDVNGGTVWIPGWSIPGGVSLERFSMVGG